MRRAERVFDIAFVGEEVTCLADRLRRAQRCFKVRDCICRLFSRDGAPGQEQARANELSKNQPFAALPRLKVSREQAGKRPLRMARLVVEGGEFHGQIIARGREFGMPQQFCETMLGRDACTFPELVTLIENASVFRVSGLCAIEGRDCTLGIAADIEERDAKVAVDGGKARIQRCSALPEVYRLIVAPPIVKQIAEIVWRARIPGDGLRNGLQNNHLFQPMRKAVVRGRCRRTLPCVIALIFRPARRNR